MLVGNDVSHWQGIIDFNVYKNNSNFLIAKATEGVNFTDGQFAYNRDESRRVGLPFGSYHFARPSYGNSAAAEANYYLDKIGPLNAGEWVTLDYEDNYTGDVVGWCLSWLDTVKNRCGVKPLIYLNQALIKKYNWQAVVNGGYGLWVAAYTYDPNDNNFITGAWGFAAMQQWTNQQTVPGIAGKVDGDVFFGDLKAFYKYGYQPTPPVPPPTEPAPPIPAPEPEPPIGPDYSAEIAALQQQVDTLSGATANLALHTADLTKRVEKLEAQTLWDLIFKAKPKA